MHQAYWKWCRAPTSYIHWTVNHLPNIEVSCFLHLPKAGLHDINFFLMDNFVVCVHFTFSWPSLSLYVFIYTFYESFHEYRQGWFIKGKLTIVWPRSCLEGRCFDSEHVKVKHWDILAMIIKDKYVVLFKDKNDLYFKDFKEL